MKKIVLSAVLALAALPVAPAAAQAPESCRGTLEVIRFTTLKPGKTIADFRKVVDQHMAWYRSHGYTKNRQIVAPVITATGESPTQIVSIHLNAPGLKQSDHDAAWEDFVNAYRAVSTVDAMRTICRPD